jgi:hypothetical protein
MVGGMIFFTLSPQFAKASGLDAARIIQLINVERSKAGLSALDLSPVLAQAATVKSSDMANYQYFSHFRPSDNKRGISFISDSGYTYQSAGENLAVYFESETDLVKAWMSSPTHKKNILSNSYSQTGVGVTQGVYQGYGTSYVAQFFAKPLAPAQQPPATPAATSSSAPQPQPVSSSSSQPPADPTPTPIESSDSSQEPPQTESSSSGEKMSQEEINELEALLAKFFANLRSQE